ncbi:MAG: acetyl esterase/lipase, partial [Verrucomicrobiales bacterium]
MNVQLLCLCLCLTSISLTAAVPTIVSIWGDEVPVDRAGTTEKAAVKITAHLPRPEMATGAAIVICPGGGYGGLVTGGEGHGIAKWLITEGIAGIVLEYRLPKGRAEV